MHLYMYIYSACLVVPLRVVFDTAAPVKRLYAVEMPAREAVRVKRRLQQIKKRREVTRRSYAYRYTYIESFKAAVTRGVNPKLPRRSNDFTQWRCRREKRWGLKLSFNLNNNRVYAFFYLRIWSLFISTFIRSV